MPDNPPPMDQTDDERRSLLDATGEFFSVGAPLHAVRAGYVRRSADDVLYENVAAGRYAHVIAPDRSGKSSLVAATAARLEANDFKVAVLDLEQIGDRDAATDAGRWYYSVAYRLLRQLRIRVDLQEWWQDKSILSNRQRLLEFYSEIILSNVKERIVIFVDEIQCIENVDFADQMLASVRSAHNSRTTDPEFSRLTFVLLGECDPISLVAEQDQSPFSVTQPIALDDFTRDELRLFSAELNVPAESAELALDRIYYWAGGQPYLTQKLARSVAREQMSEDVVERIDRIVASQFAGRSALHSEPHMSHIHRRIVNDKKHREALLTLYGRLRKGVEVTTDLGSALQRRLIAVGLIVVDDDGSLQVRNRLYARVFTSRWANDNLPTQWRAPLAVVGLLAVMLAIPFWYTQILPQGYMDVIKSPETPAQVARDAYVNFRSFPGHRGAADELYRTLLRERALAARSVDDIAAVVSLADVLPGGASLAEELQAGFWDRATEDAVQMGNRDQALMASLESLVVSSPLRRQRAAEFAGSDYASLVATLRFKEQADVVYDPSRLMLTEHLGARLTQQVVEGGQVRRKEDWTITALEVNPLLRRVVVDRPGVVNRASLTLNLSHARVGDLRIKVIAPSGRAVEVTPGVDRALATEDLRIPSEQLAGLIGEPLEGTWSLSVRDEELGVAGQLVGWNLTLNSQGLVEEFQRGINVTDPIERETDNVWFSDDGRFAIARALQSDSARIWDLALAQPVRAVAVNEQEELVGLAAGARLLVTAAQDSVNIWDTVSGDKAGSLPIEGATGRSRLTDDGLHLFTQRAADADTQLELWSVEQQERVASLTVPGIPSLIALDASGATLAIADYDRSVRVWDFATGLLLRQIALEAQPAQVSLAATGDSVGVVYGSRGASVWRVNGSRELVLEERGEGLWRLEFSPTGGRVLLGRAGHGYQLYSSLTGKPIGTALGNGIQARRDDIVGFSPDEKFIVTGGNASTVRLWRAPEAEPESDLDQPVSRSVFTVAVATPGGASIVAGDQSGNVQILPADLSSAIATTDRISFLGHSDKIARLAISADGSRVASIAADNSLRVWDAQTGLPLPWFRDILGEPVVAQAFSRDGQYLAVSQGGTLSVLESRSGDTIASISLPEKYTTMDFSGAGLIYLGSETGALSVLSERTDGRWVLQSLWRGSAPIVALAAVPDETRLVIVDADRVARQFELNSGQIGEMTLELPADLESVAVSADGRRVFFRTAGWIHQASLSVSGLVWRDATIVPRTANSRQMIPGNAASTTNSIFLPTASGAHARLLQVDFDHSNNAGLFGSREALLQEWSTRLGQDPPALEPPDVAASTLP